MLALLTLLFAQCKKEKIDNNGGTDVKKVKVRCQVPMGNGEKTDFNNLMTDGSIKWSTGTECIYLVVNGDNHQIIEFTATTEIEGATYLYFDGEVPENIIEIGQDFDIWYFGNSHKLTTPYVTKTVSDNNVITKIDGSIATQSGNLSDLGYYHIAKGTAHFEIRNGEITLEVNGGGLKNQMALAYMDLTGVSQIKGSAIVGTSYSLQYNESEQKYGFVVNDEGKKVINISNNTQPAQSYVVLLPNSAENTEVINNNFYRYVFKNSIKINNLYHIFDNSVVKPLNWEYYPYVNGYELVDLGLPSGTKWAKYNMGVVVPNAVPVFAKKEDYYGHYFQWGSTTGVSTLNFGYKYCEGSSNISGTENDAAYVNWQGGWKMPTEVQMQELITNCTWTWTTDYGSQGIDACGYIVKSKTTDKSIFLPAAGYGDDGVLSNSWVDRNTGLYYWTDKPGFLPNGNPRFGFNLLATRSVKELERSYRESIIPIRAVVKFDDI